MVTTARKSAPSRRKMRRRPGRPAGEAPGLRNRVLDAALEHYADHGIARASMRAIAAAAGVTPALIGYYFGGRDALLRAVVDERLLPAISALREPLAASGNADALNLVAAFVRAVHELVRSHPWLPRLWVREFLLEGGALRDMILTRFASQIPQALAARFAAARKQGTLNPALDPRLLVVSVIGLTLFPLAAQPIWRRAFDASDIDDAALQRHTQALLRQALEPSR